MEACGCGEEQIPWTLAKFGVLGTAGLILGLLLAMMLAGWLLVLAVSLYRRWRYPPVEIDTGTDTAAEADADAEVAESSRDSLGGFTWRTEDG
ncbi:hypothetical protein ABZ848_34870 [Streptomyces sp. NPDC047081]|uniref:hypothetical protein n=1 Tax=Streptomyces sp. NPDC047081 TaxID=3154706 RepID=UPI00340A3E99